MEKGMEKGIKQGIEQGIEQGARQRDLEIRERLKASGMSSEDIDALLKKPFG
jgi:predicted transposase YdaD